MDSLTAEVPRPTTDNSPSGDGDVQHFDVLIVGAGISGAGSAYHLKTQCPDRTYVVLESQASFGGTWLSHRFPGIRSDSDLYTFGYRFKPWVGPPIAAAAEIRKYMGDVIAENDLATHIRYSYKVRSAAWSSRDNRWTIAAEDAEGRTARFTANFLWMCQGYYRHEEGHTPDWPGMNSFKGVIAHPENWPANLDYKDKRVVIIGSGATAATMAPEMAKEAAHVTILQRSPTYYIAAPNANEFHDQLKPLGLDEHLVHDIVRRKIVTDFDALTRRSFEEPEALSQELLAGIEAFVGPETVAKHFTPSYRPWRQRIAMLPDGDMLKAVKAGTVSMITDHIDRFVPEGIRLKSGEVLEADIVATATGFNLNVLGDIAFTIDGAPLAFHDTITYRGVMFTGVPNMAWVFGYLRNSWTLRTELIADFVCRMLNHMTGRGAGRVEVALRPSEHNMPLGPWIDPENFNANYILRGQHQLPKRGDKPEWQHTQDYWSEKNEFPAIDLDDGVFRYG